jgi:predicted permease
MAGWLSAQLFALFSAGRTIDVSVAPDWRVLAFTAAVSLGACLVAGLVPALHGVRVSLNPALKEVRAQGHGGLGKSLVVAQLAISMVLVVGAALFLGTLLKLYAVDRGFNPDRLLVLFVRSAQPFAAERRIDVQDAIVQRLKTLPGVDSVSVVQIFPLSGSLWERRVQVEGYAFRSDEKQGVAFNAIAPGYFTTIGTPVLAGREFTERDRPNAPKVAIVNESFARYFFGDRSALGRQVTTVGVAYEVVGVVRDAKYQSLRAANDKTMYIASRQTDIQPFDYSYLVRVAAGNPMRVAPALDRLVRDADPALRVRSATAYSAMIEREIATERILATLGSLFGVLALVIAALGVFGVLAFQVARRTNELGVRLALGATRAAMMRLVLRDVAWMVGTGVVTGGGAALMVTGLAQTFLFGLTPSDPTVFAVAALVLTMAAVVAGWLPARRAAHVDPVVALRHE